MRISNMCVVIVGGGATLNLFSSCSENFEELSRNHAAGGAKICPKKTYRTASHPLLDSSCEIASGG